MASNTGRFMPTGFSDECGGALSDQISMHKLLGWEHLELRTILGVQVNDIPEGQYDEIADTLKQADMKVSCLGSAMAQQPIVELSLEHDSTLLRKLCRFANKLGCRYIRIMAYQHGDESIQAWRDTAAERLHILGDIAGEYGVCLVLENCVGYPDTGDKMVEFLGLCNSDYVRLAFDIGNVVYYDSEAWDYYQKVSHLIEYVHLKDTKYDQSQCFPGQGDAEVQRILADLYSKGFEGFVSIEPHVASTEHLASKSTLNRWDSYKKYGQMANDIYNKIAEDRK